MIAGNEVSIAVADQASCTSAGSCTLYMNGRGGARFESYRTSYYSRTNGATWSVGDRQADLKDDGGAECEASVLNHDGVLYFLEPEGPKRTGMILYCSGDWGKSWGMPQQINGDARGGYSDMVGLDTGDRLLAVWEDGSHPLGIDPPDQDSGNFYAAAVDVGRCTRA